MHVDTVGQRQGGVLIADIHTNSCVMRKIESDRYMCQYDFIYICRQYLHEIGISMNHEYHTYMLYGVHLSSSSVFMIHSPTTVNLSVPNVRQLTKTPPSLICLP